MKFLKKRSLLFKIIIAILIFFAVFYFWGDSNKVYAESAVAKQGGKLIEPIVDLLATLGDAIMDVLQKAVLGTEAHITLDFTKEILFTFFMIFLTVFVIMNFNAYIMALALTAIIGSLLANGNLQTVVTNMVDEAKKTYTVAVNAINGEYIPDITILPTYSISPEEIFEGKLLLFDINFFNPKELFVHTKNDTDKNAQEYDETKDGEADYYYYMDGETQVKTTKQSSAIELSKVIAKWYYSIRNIVIILMMVILLYIGIRMMLCSIASEKSKYKKMLGDWTVSMCLVFLLHYIMIFAVNINEDVVKLLENAIDDNKYVVVLKNVKAKDTFVSVIEQNSELKQYLADANGNAIYDASGSKINSAAAENFIWPTNSVGRIRMDAQMQDGSSLYVGYVIAYLVLVFYTIYFAFAYLKRVLYLAFLTVIAPLVAMTYSIDKIADSKAQAFNMWLKEYIFNLLIQPVHLLLYMLLVSMAFDLASSNIIYTLVALGFLMPAEKLVRSLFGFNRSETAPFLGGATGAALTMSAMQGLDRIRGNNPLASKGNQKGGDISSGENSGKIPSLTRPADSGKDIMSLLSGNQEDSNNMNNLLNPNNTSSKSSPTSLNSSAKNGGPSLKSSTTKNTIMGGNKNSKVGNIILGGNPPQNNKKKNLKSRLNDKSYKDYLKKRVGSATAKTLKNGAKLTGNVAKTGIRLAGTTAGVAIGAAAGIASGNLSNVGKYMALGGKVGESAGKGITNTVSASTDRMINGAKGIKTKYDQKKYGDDYQEYLNKKADDKWENDKETRKTFAKGFSAELKGFKGQEYEEKLQEYIKAGKEYRKSGATDDKINIEAMKLSSGNMTSPDSIAAAFMASKGKDLKGIETYQKKFAPKIGEKRAQQIADNAATIAGVYK